MWSELDPDSRGYCEIEVLLTWLNEYANWQVPPEEILKVFGALSGRDGDLLIPKALWFKNMRDYLLSGDEVPKSTDKGTQVEPMIEILENPDFEAIAAHHSSIGHDVRYAHPHATPHPPLPHPYHDQMPPGPYEGPIPIYQSNAKQGTDEPNSIGV